MGEPAPATENSCGSIANALTCGMGKARHLDLEVHRGAQTAAILSVTARTGAELMGLEQKWKAGLGHFDAAELDAADRMPFARSRPAISGWGCPGPGTGVEHVPDEPATGARVFSCDRDAEAAPPPCHCPIRTGR